MFFDSCKCISIDGHHSIVFDEKSIDANRTESSEKQFE